MKRASENSQPDGGDVSGRWKAVPGTAALVLTLGGGRWGNYLTIGVPPIPGGAGLSSGPPYLLDLLVLGAVARIVLNSRQRAPRTSLAIVFATLLWIYVVLRFLLSDQLDFAAVRDFAPYAYVILLPLTAMAVANATSAQLERSARWIYGALVFHAAWVAAVLLVPDAFSGAPVLSSDPVVRIFDLRSDFDAACCASVTAVAVFWILKRGRGALWAHGLVALLGLFTVVGVHSRVGLVALAVLAPLIASSLVHSRRAVLAIILSVPVLVFVAVFVVPNSTAGQRLLLEQVSPSNSQAGAAAEGTTDARQRAWEAIYRYTGEVPTRSAFGVGFGPDFMAASGGLTELVGQDRREEVRSPHNFAVGTYARLGGVGVLLFAAMLIPVLWRLRGSLRNNMSGLQAEAAVLLVSLGVAAAVGVILESPFGAVPFYFCAGTIVGLSGVAVSHGATSQVPNSSERRVTR